MLKPKHAQSKLKISTRCEILIHLLGHTKLILCFVDYSCQKEDTVGRKKVQQENSESYLKFMNLIKKHFKICTGKWMVEKEHDNEQDHQQ